MRDIYMLAIESSCDETALAIVKNGKYVIKEVVNTQIETFKDLGGVVPEVASRMHAENIFLVYEELFLGLELDWNDIDAICVTNGPGLVGSLIVGVNFAKTLSLFYNKPLIGVNHIKGHIYATNLEEEMVFPHLSLVVSGGHTELIYLKENMKFEKVGQTLDDALGESYDKVARIFNLPYPGGPEIDKLAQIGKPIYDLPLPKNDNTLDFSFSGLKSASFNFLNTAKMKNVDIKKEDFSASFQKVVVEILLKKFAMAYDKYQPKQCSIVGGVSANTAIRSAFLEKYDNIVIPFKYSTDNASMIGAYAYYKFLNNEFEEVLKFDADVSLEI